MTSITAKRLTVLTLLIGLGALPRITTAQPKFVKRTNVKVPMSDGVNLAADVYLPRAKGKFPTILVRTPYSKGGMAFFAEPMVKQGYAIVVQDVRGQQASEGTFIPFIHEKKDGTETLDWVADQPWCDGKIGIWGSSYLAYCALILAPEQHPNLAAIVNISGWGDTLEMTAPGGAMQLNVALPWTLSNQIRGQGSVQRFKWAEVFKTVPVTDIPKSMGIQSAQWEGIVKMFGSDVLTETAGISGGFNRIHVPIFHLTGWYDFVARHTLDAYEGIDRAGGAKQKLFVAPWRHDQQWLDITTVGDEDFGPNAKPGLDKMLAMSMRWFDRWLKDKKNGVDTEKPVELFIMGENDWRRFDRWPPRGVKYQPWHFDSSGSANTSAGDGRLGPQAPGGKKPDTFVYDPMDPVPTVGGANIHFFLDNLGIKDQRLVERREDMLVYTSPRLTEDLVLAGPLQAVVFAATEGRHTDITAKLVEVRSDGYARIIEDGIRRGPDPIDGQAVDLMEPGKVYRFTIDMGATAIRIPKGHRLRVEVSSSNFPKYTRNPNTGEVPERATEFRKVQQTIYHTSQYPSHVVLPVLK